MRRREFITGLGSGAALPVAARTHSRGAIANGDILSCACGCVGASAGNFSVDALRV
jgi:hypothetical protein